MKPLTLAQRIRSIPEPPPPIIEVYRSVPQACAAKGVVRKVEAVGNTPDLAPPAVGEGRITKIHTTPRAIRPSVALQALQVEELVVPVGEIDPRLLPPTATHAGNRSFYLTDTAVQADVAQWATFPAVTTLDMDSNPIERASNISTNGLSVNGLASIGGSSGALSVEGPVTVNGPFGDLSVSQQINTQRLTVDTGIIILNSTGPQTLQADGTDLLYNGEALVKANDLQNITDWALYPAIADIDANGNGITFVKELTDVSGAFGSAGQLLASNGTQIEWVGAPTASQWATFPAVQDVELNSQSLRNVLQITNTANQFGTAGQVLSSNGSQIVWTDPISTGVTTLNTQSGAVSLTSSGGSVTITNPVSGTINLEVPSSASTWANFPAVADVSIPDKNLNMTSSNTGISYNNANLDANVTIGNPLLSVGLLPNFQALVANFNIGSVTQPTSSVNVTSLGNVNILGGAGVSIAGGGGVSVSGLGGVSVTGTGAVSVQGGGISVNGGAVSLVGTSGLSIAAGGVLVNGGGIAINGGGVAVNAGALSIASGTVAVGTLSTPGGGVNIFGSNLTLLPVGPATASLRTDLIEPAVGTLNITGVSTINGAPYPPPITGAVQFSYNIYVSNVSGSDITGSGLILNPYKTIGQALIAANAIPDTNKVSIVLAAGTYTENVSVTRANTFISGGAPNLSAATNIVGSVTVDMTGSSQSFVIGGIASVQVSNIVYNNSVARNQSYLISDCLIAPGPGVSAIVATDVSPGGNGDITVQNSLIYVSNVVGVSTSNVYIAFVLTEIKNNPAIIAPVSFIQTTASGRVLLLTCSLTQDSTSPSVAPIINLANTATTAFMTVSNSGIRYSSAVSDAGTGGKCCIRFSNTGTIASLILYNNLLVCEGATTTNGTPGQFLVLQKTGAGTATLNYGQNSAGTTAHHLPPASATFIKVPYVNVV